MSDLNLDYIGTGWSFPPAFDRLRGEVAMVETVEEINQSLWILLNTAKGERVMLPDYGCDLRVMLFESLNTNTITLIKDMIQDAINLYESRIEVLQIQILTDSINEGKIEVAVNYRIRSTNSRYNIVFPFYQNEATEIKALGISL